MQIVIYIFRKRSPGGAQQAGLAGILHDTGHEQRRHRGTRLQHDAPRTGRLT